MDNHKTGKPNFHEFRMTIHQMLGMGFKSHSEKNGLNYLREAITGNSGKKLVDLDYKEKTRYRIRTNLVDSFTNYLYGAFSLCSVRDSRSATYPAIIMQLLARMEQQGIASANCHHLEECLQKEISSTREISLRKTLPKMVDMGILENAPNEGKNTRYRLAPPLPAELTAGEEIQQLQKLHTLLNLFAERLMPQSLGYHCRSTLEMILLEQGVDPEQIAQPPVIKRDARPRLMMDDEILWDLLTAQVKRNWIQLDFIGPNGIEVRSVPLQPLRVKTNPGEGRNYLIAWSREKPGQIPSRPVVLPLDTISKVHILSEQVLDRSDEDCQKYYERWFAGSFSGLSPARRDIDGNPAPLTEVLVYKERPESETDDDAWMNKYLKFDGECSMKQEAGNVYLCRYLVTRPEDLETQLLTDNTVTAVKTPGSEFAQRFLERRENWRCYGSVPPYPRVETILPGLQRDLEHEENNDSMRLFSSWYNRFFRETIGNVNTWIRNSGGVSPVMKSSSDHNTTMHETMCSMVECNAAGQSMAKEGKNVYRYYTVNVKTCVPARFTYPEMDWLERFLQDPFVRAVLGDAYCDRMRAFLNSQLDKGKGSGWEARGAGGKLVYTGYVRRFSDDGFVQLNARVGFDRDKEQLSHELMGPIFHALTHQTLLHFDNHTYSGEVRENNTALPVWLEYMPGAGSLRMLMYQVESREFFVARCINLKNVHADEQPVSQEVRDRCREDKESYLRSREQTCSLIAQNDPDFLVRVTGVLQPYLDSIYADDNGAVRIELRFYSFEGFHLVKILKLLHPGILLEKTTDPYVNGVFQSRMPR